MRNKNLVKVVGLLSMMVCPSIAFSMDAIKLNCPAGTRQSSGTNGKALEDIVACVKTDRGQFTPHGATIFLYPSKAKQAEGMSENGFRTGLWTFYNEQGRKTGTAMFKGSSFHGDVIEFHENGAVKKLEQYSEGLREGVAKEFSADGKLVKQAEYRNNREVAVK